VFGQQRTTLIIVVWRVIFIPQAHHYLRRNNIRNFVDYREEFRAQERGDETHRHCHHQHVLLLTALMPFKCIANIKQHLNHR